jgi:ABC-type dipeptide/oligopeptide/nickel transport system permease component
LKAVHRGGAPGLIAAAFVVVANIIIDFCYTAIDPRVRIT